MNWLPQGSGIRIREEIVPALEQRWAQRTGAGAAMSPDEVSEGDGFLEGARRTVVVNGFERNPVARRECIKHYGYSCFVCGLNLGDRYGESARKCIHVHHVVPLSTIGSEYRVDPVKDLRPLCPNCHAAIHLEQPMLTPEELRKRIGK